VSKPSDSNLSAWPPNLQVRHKNTEAVFTGCVETAELDDGYGLCYPDTPAWEEKLEAFMSDWRVGSPNMHFSLRREVDTHRVWLEITGPEGTKQFVEGARYMLTSHLNPAGSLMFSLRHGLRFLTSPLRLKPDFVVIGAKKCGTTALYDYMTQHPAIAPALKKEIYYFNAFHGRSQYWYRAFFPTLFERMMAKGRTAQPFLTGEATPDYLYQRECPERVRHLIPKAQLIAILRNPVDRAYSFYNHNLRAGLETLSFEAAIDAEEERLAEERERMVDPDRENGFAFMNYSYKARGVYVDQLTNWADVFPTQQLLVLKTEDLFKDPERTLRRAFGSLDLPYHAPAKFRKMNTAPYDPLQPHVRRKLEDHFAPHNARLAKFLGTDPLW
jgi:hypothetical protein